jgi:hypothetical protein
MLDVHLYSADFLGCLAIFTAVMRSRRNLVAGSSGDRLHAGTLDLAEEGFSPAQTG